MDRIESLLREIDTSMFGLEVAPWFNPITPKAAGYNVHTLDVFDFETLMQRAKEDPSIDPQTYSKLEPIDYVGSATELLSLVPAQLHGKFDYVISSHNFEHLPNPIKFLQACEVILTDGGTIVMAVPDGRACFDYFRPHTVTADWLEAFVEDRKQPSERQLFAAHVDLASVKGQRNNPQVSVSFDTPRAVIENHTTLIKILSNWKERRGKAPYLDAHCTVMTPASLRLLIEDCVALGLFSFDIQEISGTTGVEFFVRLVKRANRPDVSPETYQSRRTELMHDIWSEQAIRAASKYYGTAALAEFSLIGAANSGLLERIKFKIRLLNRARVAKRRGRSH